MTIGGAAASGAVVAAATDGVVQAVVVATQTGGMLESRAQRAIQEPGVVTNLAK